MTDIIDKRRFGPEKLAQYESNVIIPPITDPLGKHWDQPSTKNIVIDENNAVMSKNVFNQLKEYSASIPTGVYPGKMWKRYDGVFDQEFIARGGKPTWKLCWYGEIPNKPELCSINMRDILIVE